MIQRFGIALAAVALYSLVLIGCTSTPAASPSSVQLPPDNTPSPASQPAVGQASPAVAPIDARIAFVRARDIYLLDATTGIETRLTEDGANSAPRWTSDGSALFFTKNVPGENGLRFQAVPVDGTSPVELDFALTRTNMVPWAPDDSFVVFSAPGGRETYVRKNNWPVSTLRQALALTSQTI